MTWWPHSWRAVLAPDAPIAELVVRGSAIYFFLFALMRVAGRRLLARFAMSDILVVLLLAVAVREGLTGGHTTVGDAMVVALVILGWDMAIDRIAFHFPSVRHLLRHEPTRVIHHGRLLVDNARALLLTRAEVMEKLHQHGVSSYDEVENAWLEPDGSLSVVRRGG